MQRVLVRETQQVRAGAPLVILDDADARIMVEQAQAALGQAERKVRGYAASDDALAPHRRMVDAVFHRVPTIPTRYVHVLDGAGDPTLEITAGGPISAFVEAAGEATKTGSGSSKPDILSRNAR